MYATHLARLCDLIHRLLQVGLIRIEDAPTDRDTTLLGHLQSYAQENFGPPLKAIHVPIDEWLGGLPMTVALACAVGLYILALIWVWRLSRDFVFRGAPDQNGWRDLRVWATIVTIPYIAIYLVLGI